MVQVNNPALSEAVQRVAFAAGIVWEQYGASVSHTNQTICIVSRIHASMRDCTWSANRLYIPGFTGVSNLLPRYDAATQFGEIVRLLSTPVKPLAPKLPRLHDYRLDYVKNGGSVQFGCAHINLALLSAITMDYNALSTGHGCNRAIAAITLCSGKVITREQAKEILAYVEWVNAQP